jgi:hypothetical protein
MEIYLDESGNLGGIGSHASKLDPYFVLAALIVNDGLPIKRCIKGIRHKKIKKRYHWSSVKVDASRIRVTDLISTLVLYVGTGRWASFSSKHRYYYESQIAKFTCCIFTEFP